MYYIVGEVIVPWCYICTSSDHQILEYIVQSLYGATVYIILMEAVEYGELVSFIESGYETYPNGYEGKDTKSDRNKRHHYKKKAQSFFLHGKFKLTFSSFAWCKEIEMKSQG